METLVAVVHIFVALILIALILVQDSKSGSLGGAFGGGGSNSLLGATGASTLAQKATRVAAVIFAVTCITLTLFSSQNHKSILDNVILNAPPTMEAPAAAPAATDAAPATPAEPGK